MAVIARANPFQAPFKDTLRAAIVEAAALIFGVKCFAIKVVDANPKLELAAHEAMPEVTAADLESSNARLYESYDDLGLIGPCPCDHPTVFVVPLLRRPGALCYHPATAQWFILHASCGGCKCLQATAARNLRHLDQFISLSCPLDDKTTCTTSAAGS